MNSKTKNIISMPREPETKYKVLCYVIPLILSGIAVAGYTLMNGLPVAGGYYMIHYLYTYNHGYIARGLVGEVLSLLFDNISDNIISWTVFVFSVLYALTFALFSGSILRRCLGDTDRLTFAALIITVLYASPATFRIYMGDIKLDKFFWALTFMAMLVLDKKYLVWFIPLICAVATCVNPVFLLMSMLLISIAMLREFVVSGYSKKYGIICAVSYISMIALGVYACVSESFVGFETPREMIDYYFSRYTGSVDMIDYDSYETQWLFDYFSSFPELVKKSFRIYFVGWENGFKCILSFLFFALPVFSVFSVFWKKSSLKTDNKMQKFIYFLCAISPVATLPAILVSWEASKYFTCNAIVQMFLMAYFISKNDLCVTDTLKELFDYLREHFILSASTVAYLAMLFS